MDVDVRASMPGEALVYGSVDLEGQNRALPCVAAPGRADRPEATGWETLSSAMGRWKRGVQGFVRAAFLEASRSHGGVRDSE